MFVVRNFWRKAHPSICRNIWRGNKLPAIDAVPLTSSVSYKWPPSLCFPVDNLIEKVSLNSTASGVSGSDTCCTWPFIIRAINKTAPLIKQPFYYHYRNGGPDKVKVQSCSPSCGLWCGDVGRGLNELFDWLRQNLISKRPQRTLSEIWGKERIFIVSNHNFTQSYKKMLAWGNDSIHSATITQGPCE